MIRKSIYTNQPLDKVTHIALETFKAWTQFARGEGTTPFGYSLKQSSGLLVGRYAASLSFPVYGRVEFVQEAQTRSGNQGRKKIKSMAGKSRSKEFNQVVFQADDKYAPEARVLEYGRPSLDMKQYMLKSNYKVSKDGVRYRVIPMPRNEAMQMMPALSKEMTHIGKNKKSMSSRLKQETNTLRERLKVATSDFVFRTMTDRPDGKWKTPVVMPHNVMGQFLEQLRRKLGGRV